MRSDDYEDAEEPISPLPGGPPSTTEDPTGLGELLLTTTMALVHVGILMKEIDEGEWKAVELRFAALKEAWGRVPLAPVAKRVLGFRPRARRSRGKK